jgi:hypothetical protein
LEHVLGISLECDIGEGDDGCFQATGTPMAKIQRLHLSVQCALREITIFAIEKVEKIFHCKEIGI